MNMHFAVVSLCTNCAPYQKGKRGKQSAKYVLLQVKRDKKGHKEYTSETTGIANSRNFIPSKKDSGNTFSVRMCGARIDLCHLCSIAPLLLPPSSLSASAPAQYLDTSDIVITWISSFDHYYLSSFSKPSIQCHYPKRRVNISITFTIIVIITSCPVISNMMMTHHCVPWPFSFWYHGLMVLSWCYTSQVICVPLVQNIMSENFLLIPSNSTGIKSVK